MLTNKTRLKMAERRRASRGARRHKYLEKRISLRGERCESDLHPPRSLQWAGLHFRKGWCHTIQCTNQNWATVESDDSWIIEFLNVSLLGHDCQCYRETLFTMYNVWSGQHRFCLTSLQITFFCTIACRVMERLFRTRMINRKRWVCDEAMIHRRISKWISSHKLCSWSKHVCLVCFFWRVMSSELGWSGRITGARLMDVCR